MVTPNGHWRFLLLALILGVMIGPVLAEEAAKPVSEKQVRAVVQPRQQAMLSSEIAARIERLSLREGERFKKGERLVEFDCRNYRFALAAAKATVDRAQAKLSTEQTLAAHHSSGALEVALARSDADKARAELNATSLAVEHCTIPAPFDGRVVELKARAFETVAPHTPLLGILDDSDPEVAMVVPALWLSWLKPGQPFQLVIDETTHTHPGKIIRLAAQIETVSQTITAYGALADPDRDLVSGMSGNAHFQEP